MRKTQQIHETYSRDEVLKAYEVLAAFYQRNGLSAKLPEIERLYHKNKLAFQLFEARRLDLGQSELDDLSQTKRSLFITH